MQALLAPTVINDQYASVDAIMATPGTTTQTLVEHGSAGDRANVNGNADKAAALTLLEKWFPPPGKRKRWPWRMWAKPDD